MTTATKRSPYAATIDAQKAANAKQPKTTDCPIEPLGGMVALELEGGEKISQGGIVLPESAKEAMERGRVVAVGPGKSLETGHVQKMVLTVGDTVIFRRHFGTYYDHGNRRFKMIAETDVLARVRPEVGAVPV